jgi:transposase
MERLNELPPELEALEGAESYAHGFLPLAAAYCRRLGLAELIDALVPSKMEVSPGLVVQAMVLDTLSGRSPLYRLEDFLSGQDIELLLGTAVESRKFNDTNIGRSLDAIFDAGASKILTEIGIRAAREFKLDASVVSYDTTSTSVWGDYRRCDGETTPETPKITYGHSKDKRPDLKQFMTELLCVERGIPIFGNTLDGNSSDKTSNNKLLSRISGIMARHGLGNGAFVYVADSAMVTENSLNELDVNKFVSRLPANYAVCGETILKAVANGEWIELGALAETPDSINRPAASYKALETTVELHGRAYRAVVVHSDSHDKRRRKKIDKALESSEKNVKAQLKGRSNIYNCEADAVLVCGELNAITGALHRVEASVVPFQAKLPGRPPRNKLPTTKTKYKLEWTIAPRKKEVEKLETIAGCFVLISNVPESGEEGLNARELLRTYKGQYGVESGFAFLKDPIVVNDTFLKTDIDSINPL